MILNTDRLVLRPLDAADARDIARMIAEWEVIRWLTTPPWPYRLDDAIWFIGDEASRGSFAITRGGEFLGVAGVGGELGYWLGQPHWGQGIMTEAARAVTGHYFDGGGEVLNSGHLLGNAASANVLTKLGFRPGGIVRRMSRPLAREVPIRQMTLTADQWRTHHAA